MRSDTDPLVPAPNSEAESPKRPSFLKLLAFAYVTLILVSNTGISSIFCMLINMKSTYLKLGN